MSLRDSVGWTSIVAVVPQGGQERVAALGLCDLVHQESQNLGRGWSRREKKAWAVHLPGFSCTDGELGAAIASCPSVRGRGRLTPRAETNHHFTKAFTTLDGRPPTGTNPYSPAAAGTTNVSP